jgi:hypothetical protein
LAAINFAQVGLGEQPIASSRLALKNRLPTISGETSYAQAGFIKLRTKYHRQFAPIRQLCRKILKGAKPADQVRAGHQQEDREGDRADDPTVTARASQQY